MRTSLKVDAWAGTQSRRHTTIHECNKSARLFREARADKQCLSSTIRGRKPAALFRSQLADSTATNGIVPNFCSHACHISNMRRHRRKAFHVFSMSCVFCHRLRRGTPCRLSTEGNPPRALPPSFLRAENIFFFFCFPQTLA